MFVASRLLVVAAAFVAEALIPRNPVLDPGADGPDPAQPDELGRLVLPRHRPRRLPGGPVSGDYSNIAFPPLYPVVVRLLSLPIPGFEGIVAVLVSNVAFLVALALLVRLGTPYLGRRRAATGGRPPGHLSVRLGVRDGLHARACSCC